MTVQLQTTKCLVPLHIHFQYMFVYNIHRKLHAVNIIEGIGLW